MILSQQVHKIRLQIVFWKMGTIKILSVYLTHSLIWRSLSNLIYSQASLPPSRFVTNKLDSLVVHFYISLPSHLMLSNAVKSAKTISLTQLIFLERKRIARKLIYNQSKRKRIKHKWDSLYMYTLCCKKNNWNQRKTICILIHCNILFFKKCLPHLLYIYHSIPRHLETNDESSKKECNIKEPTTKRIDRK